MLLDKTPKAHQELASGARRLNLRERSLLLLAEGMPYAQLAQMYHGQGQLLLDRLLRAGYLAPRLQAASAAPCEAALEPHEP